MALDETAYPWESRVVTDFNQLALSEAKHQQVAYEADETALVAISDKNKELVPIFSSQVIQRYEQFTYKGLEADIGDMIKNATEVDENGKKKFVPITEGLSGIASSYEGENDG